MANADSLSHSPTSPAQTQPVASRPRRSRRGRSGGLRFNLFDAAYAREMMMPMTLGMLVLMLVMAGNFVYWAINSIVNQGLGLAPVVRLFFLALPGFAIQGVAVGLILAICLVLNRAVRDNEIIALRAGGASVHRILLPFWVVALSSSGVDWVLMEYIAPRTNDMAEKSLAKLMKTSATQLIEGDKYFRVGNYYFYVQSVENRVLQNVMIYERGSGTFTAFAPTTFPTVLLAQSAHEDPKKANRWILDGVIQHIYNDKGELKYENRFQSWTIDVGQQLSSYWAEQKNPFSMTGSELNKRIEDLDDSAFDAGKLREMRVEYQRRYALPFACFVMALSAAPLSLRFARHGSFAGLVCAFGLAFLWQGFDGWFRALGIAGTLEPVIAAWGTNAIFLVAGAAMLWRER